VLFRRGKMALRVRVVVAHVGPIVAAHDPQLGTKLDRLSVFAR
jgi:hypothetical protein